MENPCTSTTEIKIKQIFDKILVRKNLLDKDLVIEFV